MLLDTPVELKRPGTCLVWFRTKRKQKQIPWYSQLVLPFTLKQQKAKN